MRVDCINHLFARGLSPGWWKTVKAGLWPCLSGESPQTFQIVPSSLGGGTAVIMKKVETAMLAHCAQLQNAPPGHTPNRCRANMDFIEQ